MPRRAQRNRIVVADRLLSYDVSKWGWRVTHHRGFIRLEAAMVCDRIIRDSARQAAEGSSRDL